MRNALSFLDILKLILFLLFNRKYTQGKNVEKFEELWSKWLCIKHSLFVSSGSTANFLLLAAIKEQYKLKTGTKILVPACTWATTIGPVLQLGFTPVFCDINIKDNFSFDRQLLNNIKKKHNIKIVFITHLLGMPANVSYIKSIFPKAILLEDCCESHGAIHLLGKVGTFGVGSTFSFYFGHHMTTIEGGMICTNDTKLYELMRMKRFHGLSREIQDETLRKKYEKGYEDIHPKFLFATDGFNFRNTELGAILGMSQLKKLDSFIVKRWNNFVLFNSIISQYNCFHMLSTLGNSSFCLPFVCKSKEIRNKLIEELEKEGIETRPILAGNLLKHPFLKQFKHESNNFKNAELIHENGFYIGNNQFIKLKDINKLREICEKVCPE
jgi:CDP-6-deoxy-D-xylo-4-hexulose-3-dehydrase